MLDKEDQPARPGADFSPLRAIFSVGVYAARGISHLGFCPHLLVEQVRRVL